MNQMQMNKLNNTPINPNMINNQMQMRNMGMQGMAGPKLQPMMPMMPMRMYPVPNPMIMQTLYHQDIMRMMRQKELQQLNNNYEYQLMRQKINEQYKVVDEKNEKNK